MRDLLKSELQDTSRSAPKQGDFFGSLAIMGDDPEKLAIELTDMTFCRAG